MSIIATPRGKIYNSILDTVGGTPIVRLDRLKKAIGSHANLLAKLEFFNPMSSVKDRIGVAMIEDAIKNNNLSNDSIIVEPTSGNTCIALAFVCAAKGLKLILTMPDSMSIERRKMLALLGAKIELTPAEKGMGGAIDRANQIVKNDPNAFILQQFDNPANPAIHRDTTAQEILADTKGTADILISGVGTGGTLTGIAEILKKHNSDFYVVAVEPEDSPVISGGLPGAHKLQGIGPGFIPKNLNTDLIDEVLKIGTESAMAMAKKVAKLEGIPGGISSGAALAAAVEIGQRDSMKNKNMVIILPSFAERYLSTALFDGITWD